MTTHKSTDISQTRILQAPPISYSIGCDSFVLALQSAAGFLDRPVSYAMLKGLSALSFRLLFHEGWHRFSPDALVGFDHLTLAFNCLGLHAKPDRINFTRQSSVDNDIQQIKESLDAGLPVLALHLGDWEDWGLIVGYAEGEHPLICRTPHDPDPTIPTRNKHWPVMVLTIDRVTTPPDQRACIMTSLQAAVTLFNTDQFGEYKSGRNAYRFWISDLRDASIYTDLSEPEDHSYPNWVKDLQEADIDQARMDRRYNSPYLERAHVNAWRLKSLIDARKSAAIYCQEIAKQFPATQANYFQEAAISYTAVKELLETARSLAPWESELAQRRWSQKLRDQQAGILEQALVMEECAIGYIAVVLNDQVSFN